MQINIKVSHKLISLSSIPKVLKVTSFQYLKKEVRNGVHFLHAVKHQSSYKVTLSFLMEVARHVQSTQNKKLVMFFQYIKKKLLQLFLCSIVMQKKSGILRGSSQVRCYLFYIKLLAFALALCFG